MTDHCGKTAEEWHSVALEWKRRALNAEIRAKEADRKIEFLVTSLSTMDDVACDLVPIDANGTFR